MKKIIQSLFILFFFLVTFHVTAQSSHALIHINGEVYQNVNGVKVIKHGWTIRYTSNRNNDTDEGPFTRDILSGDEGQPIASLPSVDGLECTVLWTMTPIAPSGQTGKFIIHWDYQDVNDGSPHSGDEHDSWFMGGGYNNGQKFNAHIEWIPDVSKSCTVSLSSQEITAGQSVSVNYGGSGNNDGEPVRTYIQSAQSGQALGGIYGGSTNAELDRCTSPDCSASTTTDATLPVGSYLVHCDQPDSPNRCSGNPYCTINGGSTDCGSWNSCSDSDFGQFTVNPVQVVPTPTPPSPPFLKFLLLLDKGKRATTTGYSNFLLGSGLMEDELGTSLYNGLRLSVFLSPVNPDTRAYVAFYDKTLTGGTPYPQVDAQFLVFLKAALNQDKKKGFLLKYEKNKQNIDDWFVWDENDWRSVKEREYPVSDTNGVLYTILQTEVLYTNVPATWEIEMRKAFGSHKFFTPIYGQIGGTELNPFGEDFIGEPDADGPPPDPEEPNP